MNPFPELSAPWLAALVAIPVLGAVAPGFLLRERRARHVLLWVTAVELVLAAAAALDFHTGAAAALRVDPLDPGPAWLGRPLLFVDELNSLLFPFAALIFGIVALALPRTERHGGSTRRILAAEAAALGTFATAEPAVLAAFWLLFAALVPPQRREDPAAGKRRAVTVYMSLSVILFTAGVLLGYVPDAAPAIGRAASAGIVAAVLIRKGIMPLHSWMVGFFERAALPEAILFSAPQIGAYAAVRLIVPEAPDSLLTFIVTASLVTAMYGAGLALVQADARRAFGAFFMSQSALVMTGLHSRTAIATAGGLALWISSGLALAGFGMTMAALEARRGPLSLRRYSGGFERTPFLAGSFLLLGLAAVGFPGTLGFVGEEALVEGVVAEHPLVGTAVLFTSALNGLLVLRAFFLLFGGASVPVQAHHRTRLRERAAFLVLLFVLLGAGLAPQFFLASRYRAAGTLLSRQAVTMPAAPGPTRP